MATVSQLDGYNFLPDPRSLEIYPEILYTQLRNLGTRLAYDKMAEKFVNMANLPSLTPTTVLGNRCGYMFAIRGRLTLKSISIDKKAEMKLNFDAKGSLLGATGKGCLEEVRYLGQSNTHTVFVVKFGQGTCCLQLAWNEATEPTVISSKSKSGNAKTASSVQYTDVDSVSYEVDCGSNSEQQMQCEAVDAVPENPQELKECTNVLVLVSADNQRLWNAIYSAMKDQIIKAEHNRIIVRLMLNPFNPITVLALAYYEGNIGDVRVAVSCADNVIFFGNSSTSYSYVLSSITDQTNEFKFDNPFLNPQQWRRMSTDINDMCFKSASVLDMIKEHGKQGKFYAFMMSTSDNDDYTHVPDMMQNQIIPRCKATPITPELYTCWKFTGLVGQTEEEYRRRVNEFIQRYGIPAVIDDVCRGCVAVIMHGPRWLWWYLTTFKDDMSMTFGSDLRSITQIGVNNVTELMKRRDNMRFQDSLSRLRHRMISQRVPRRIRHKMSIVFASGSRNAILSCNHSKVVETLARQTKSAITVRNPHIAIQHENSNSSSQPRYVDTTRKEIEQIHIQQKHATGGTEGAHIISHEFANGVLRETGQRVAQNTDELISILESDANIWIKTGAGNELDSAPDIIIVEKFRNNEPLTTKAKIQRAAQIVNKTQFFDEQSSTLDTISRHLGQMQIHTGNPGRPQTVSSYVNTPPPTNIDMRSSAYQSGEVKLRSDGRVDKRCSAYQYGSTLTKSDGTLNGSASTREGTINFKSSSPSNSSGSQSSSSGSKRK